MPKKTTYLCKVIWFNLFCEIVIYKNDKMLLQWIEHCTLASSVPRSPRWAKEAYFIVGLFTYKSKVVSLRIIFNLPVSGTKKLTPQSVGKAESWNNLTCLIPILALYHWNVMMLWQWYQEYDVGNWTRRCRLGTPKILVWRHNHKFTIQ